MTNKQIVVGLNCIAAAGLAVGGATAIPDCPLAKPVLFYGLLVAGIAKAIASTLVQYKDESDEQQGITPEQKAGVQAVHDAANKPATTATIVKASVIAFLLLNAGEGRAQRVYAPFYETGAGGTPTATTNLTTSAPVVIPALSGLESLIITNLIDDLPYVSNKVVIVDVAALYNPSNPKGKGKIGEFGSITLPTSQQSSVGIGFGEMAHRSFITPVNFTVGTTLQHLPAALGNVYSFVGDGVLYDFTGKQLGNWVEAGFFKHWDISKGMGLGLKVGTFNDSVIPGIGWFGALTGTF